MERKLNFSVNEYYHLYNRGSNKCDIFLDDNDRKRFMRLLFFCNGAKPVVFKLIQGMPLDKQEKGEGITDIGAYCLMPNHFHILVRERKENGISKFLEKLSTAYSMYFNKKYERTGSLFENRFKATHADSDEYLKYLFSYIHLNPVKLIDPRWKENGIKDKMKSKGHLDSYRYSSYPDYRGVDREESVILNRSVFPEYFSKPADFDDFIDEWLSFSEVVQSPTFDFK